MENNCDWLSNQVYQANIYIILNTFFDNYLHSTMFAQIRAQLDSKNITNHYILLNTKLSQQIWLNLHNFEQQLFLL